METERSSFYEMERFVLVAIVLLALSAQPANLKAQGPEPNQVAVPAAPAGTAFTYQGKLAQGGTPVDDTCDLRFILYDAETGGSQVGPIQEHTGISVTTGLFTIPDLDFGSDAFTGEARWLDVAVKCTGDEKYATLSPRQALTATPYALYALNLPDHDHWGERWSGSGTGLALSGGTIGLQGIGTTYGLYGSTDSKDGRGVYGLASANSGTTYGVYGSAESPNGRGLFGIATAITGTAYGVFGVSNSIDGGGVFGSAVADSGKAYGVTGLSYSPNGAGVYGASGATTGTPYGVYGASAASEGRGVYGAALTSTGLNYGVHGQSFSTDGCGVYGEASAITGMTYGVHGLVASPGGRGVYGWATATSGGNSGVYGQSDSASGDGVHGYASAESGTTYGVRGQAASSNGRGVYGWASASSGTNYGVYGQTNSSSGRGVYGQATANSGTTYGVYGQTSSTGGRGVYGWATASSGSTYGVYGKSESSDGYAVYGSNLAGVAGQFDGAVNVNGKLTKNSGSFKIDHPLDPAGKYLYHSFVESPDMLNVYNGNVTLDEQGTAWVELPDWFAALNGGIEHQADFRYQLTCIGGYAPVYVAREIADNRFLIAGGTPGLKVSWLLTGIRHDPYAEAHRIRVEEDKPAGEQGTYLHPELYGQPEELGVAYRHQHPQEGGGR